jgi:hypothetical protein
MRNSFVQMLIHLGFGLEVSIAGIGGNIELITVLHETG